jgi:hypothetical protein
MQAKNGGAGIHFQWIPGEPNHQQFSSYGDSFHETFKAEVESRLIKF